MLRRSGYDVVQDVSLIEATARFHCPGTDNSRVIDSATDVATVLVTSAVNATVGYLPPYVGSQRTESSVGGFHEQVKTLAEGTGAGDDCPGFGTFETIGSCDLMRLLDVLDVTIPGCR